MSTKYSSDSGITRFNSTMNMNTYYRLAASRKILTLTTSVMLMLNIPHKSSLPILNSGIEPAKLLVDHIPHHFLGVLCRDLDPC
jgi:hypothetical protein